MLDTNIVSDLVLNPQGLASKRLRHHGDDGICVRIITAAELRFGAAANKSARLLASLEAVLSAAHACSINVTLVTHNTKEFCRVRGLTIDDWLA